MTAPKGRERPLKPFFPSSLVTSAQPHRRPSAGCVSKPQGPSEAWARPTTPAVGPTCSLRPRCSRATSDGDPAPCPLGVWKPPRDFDTSRAGKPLEDELDRSEYEPPVGKQGLWNEILLQTCDHVTAPSWNPAQLPAPWATLPLQRQVTCGQGCDPIEQPGVAKAAQAPHGFPPCFLSRLQRTLFVGGLFSPRRCH